MYAQPPYTLFQIMDGIVHLPDESPSNKDILDSTFWTMEYAESACNTPISGQQAEHIKTIGKQWLERLESGEESDETYERWAKQEIEPYEQQPEQKMPNFTIEMHETDTNKFCPYLIIQPIRAVIHWSAGYHSPEEDKAMREDALARANRIVKALEAQQQTEQHNG